MKRLIVLFVLILQLISTAACGSSTQVIPVPTVKPTEPPAVETPLTEREPIPDNGEKAEQVPESEPEQEPNETPPPEQELESVSNTEQEPDSEPEADIYIPGDTDISVYAEETEKLPVYYYSFNRSGYEKKTQEYLNVFMEKKALTLNLYIWKVRAVLIGTKKYKPSLYATIYIKTPSFCHTGYKR
jgi:hypothetical protein